MWKQSKQNGQKNETSVCPSGSAASVKMSDTNTAVQEKQKKVKFEAKSKVLDEETYWLLM